MIKTTRRLLLFFSATALLLVLLVSFGKRHGSHSKTIFRGKVQTTPKTEEGSCPTIDELLSREMRGAAVKLEIPPEKNHREGREENIKILEQKSAGKQGNESNGIRIVLRYEDETTLLTRAERYGLTHEGDNASPDVPYYFILYGTGKRLYFSNASSFKRFLNDIGGKEIFQKAKKEIVIGLASGRRFELIEYK